MTAPSTRLPIETVALTPRAADITQTILAEVLQSARFNRTGLLKARLSKPFNVTNPQGSSAQSPLAQSRHVGVLHLVIGGSCEIEVNGSERHALSAGDVVLLPLGAAHRLHSGHCDGAVRLADLLQPASVEGLWSLDHGGGGDTTEIISGFIELGELFHSPIFSSLPSVLIDRNDNNPLSALLMSTARGIVTHAATPGIGLVIARLIEVLFVNVVRNCTARLPSHEKGLFSACSDTIVGRALRSIHLDAARRWRIRDLAREAGTSRSVLNNRFNSMVGQPPIEYLARWRIQLAMQRLRSTEESLASVAAAVGYESHAAFTRAFKRFVGLSPGRWREAEAADRRRARTGESCRCVSNRDGRELDCAGATAMLPGLPANTCGLPIKNRSAC